MPGQGLSAPAQSRYERDADTELYDRACDVLLAAQDLRSAAARRAANAAAAPTLGCLEQTLSELADAVSELAAEARPDLDVSAQAAGDHTTGSAAARYVFGELHHALLASARVCAAARQATGPMPATGRGAPGCTGDPRGGAAGPGYASAASVNRPNTPCNPLARTGNRSTIEAWFSSQSAATAAYRSRPTSSNAGSSCRLPTSEPTRLPAPSGSRACRNTCRRARSISGGWWRSRFPRQRACWPETAYSRRLETCSCSVCTRRCSLPSGRASGPTGAAVASRHEARPGTRTSKPPREHDS
jgi:hypothetical protein